MKQTSIIVPTWNGVRWISDCLQTIQRQCRPDDEVIVVDNGSVDDTPNLVEHDFPQVRLVRLDRNLGFAGGVNRGLQIATGDLLILVNQDVKLLKGCLDALRNRLRHVGSAIIGCKLLFPDGHTIQHAGGVIRFPRAAPKHRGYRQPDDARWDVVTDVDYVTGAVIAFDRAILSTVGLLDEEFYPGYFEEVDYCFRARAAGFPILYEPAAMAIHHESQSTDGNRIVYHQALQRGRLRFVLKHQNPAQIFNEFVPAERSWLPNTSTLYRRQVLAHAYMRAMLSVPQFSATGLFGASSARHIIKGLSYLHSEAVTLDRNWTR